MKVDGFIREDVATQNVIAETPDGRVRPDRRGRRAPGLGLHGPGINDDGSGVSMMLETAEEMAELITPRNKVRFIFFSGEEQGLLGSDTTSRSSPRSKSRTSQSCSTSTCSHRRTTHGSSTTAMATNMASPGPNGSGTVEQVFKDFWDSQGLKYETIPFDGRSDYDAFTTAGIPGRRHLRWRRSELRQPCQVALYGGQAGVPFDRCYHQLCDDLSNINDDGLEEHSDAAVHAILTFARRHRR